MALSKSEAIKVAFSCASEYKTNLMDRSLLFVCMDKHKRTFCFETVFYAANFQHLTGLKTDKTGIKPGQFFDLCISKRMSEGDFEFSEDGTTPMKLQVLPKMVKQDLSASMVGNYSGNQPKLYTEKLAGGISGCMGFVRDEGELLYKPNTVLNEDIRKISVPVQRIILTYSKPYSEKQYEKIVHVAKKIEWNKISFPKGFEYLPIPAEKQES